MGRVRTLASVTALVGALVLAGCGKGDPQQQAEVQVGPPTAELLGQAAATTKQAGTGRYEGTMKASVHGGGGMFGGDVELAATIQGTYDTAAKREHDVLVLETYRESGTPAGSRPPAPKAGDRAELVIDGDTTYQQETEGGTTTLHNGKPWVVHRGMPGQGVLSMLLGGGGAGVGPSINGPDDLLEALTAVSGNVVDQGAEDVRGVATRHLHADVSIAELEKRVGGGTTTTMAGPLGGCALAGDRTMPVDVNVDADKRVRRITVDVDMTDWYRQLAECFGKDSPFHGTVPTDGFSYTTTITLDFLDVGQPVTIDLPPADQVDDPFPVGGPRPTAIS